jgi:hypothetical protein
MLLMATKRFITQTLKKITVAGLIGFVAFGSLMIIPAGHVAAVTVASGGGGSAPLIDSFSPNIQAQIYSSIQLVLSSDCNFATTTTAFGLGSTGISASDISLGNWFVNNGSNGGSTGNIGQHVSPTDGMIDCANGNSWFSNLLNQAGLAGNLQATAAQVFNVNADGTYSPKANGASNTALRTIFQNQFFGGAAFPSNVPYYIADEILTADFASTAANACNAQPAPSAPDAYALAAAGHTAVTIAVYDPATKQVTNQKYLYKNAGNAMTVGHGLGVGTAGQAQCSTIASSLSNPKYANALKAYVAAHPNTAADTLTSGPAAATKPTCEAGGVGLNWILCPVFNTVSGFCNWLFDNLVQPLLRSAPISTNSADPSFKIWSNFRIYGDVFLVIALLVVVFGQSLGGGLIDAYTAKKVLPRLLAAAILINLSIYIVAFLVDMTNIIGGGLGSLITAPLSGAGAFKISPTGIQAGAIAGFSGVGLVGAWGVGILTSLTSVDAAAFIGLFVLLPALLGLLAAVVTLILRKAIILALVLVSPIAFALYCLPNTEKYFHKWWELLLQTLAVYPIVIMIFAIADVLTVTLTQANQGAVLGSLALVIAFILQFLPLVLIPYAFKLAGGMIGNLHGTLNALGKRTHEGVKGNANDPTSLRNRTRYNMRSAVNAGRERRYGQFAASSKTNSGFKRWGATRLARIAGTGNLQAERAKYNEEQDKIIGSQYSSGNDDTIRSLWAKQGSNGRWYSTYGQPNARYGSWDEANTAFAGGDSEAFTGYDEKSAADVSKARQLVGGDTSRFQAYSKYEMGKAANDGQLDAFKSRFLELNNDMGYTPGEANGIWAGVKFAHQNSRKEQKYTSIGGDKGHLEWGEINHTGLSNELVDTMRKGDYSGFRQSTGVAARSGYSEASGRLASYDYDTDSNLKDGKPIHDRQKDETTYQNYRALGAHLQSSFIGQGMSPAMRAQIEAQGGDEAAGTIPGYGLGASANAEAEWKAFVSETTQPITPATPPIPPPTP